MNICTEIENMTDKEFAEFMQDRKTQIRGMDTVSRQPKNEITMITSDDIKKLKPY